MAIVKRFNVNREQATLDADIIENMSANDVSYYDSIQYNENTVGDKLSELESEVIDFVLNLHDADLNLNVFGSARHRLDTKYNASKETSVVIFKNLNIKRDNTISFT